MKAVDLMTRMMMVVPTDAADVLLSKIKTLRGPTPDAFAPDIEHKTIHVDSASHVSTQPLFKSAARSPKKRSASGRKDQRRAKARARAKQRAKR